MEMRVAVPAEKTAEEEKAVAENSVALVEGESAPLSDADVVADGEGIAGEEPLPNQQSGLTAGESARSSAAPVIGEESPGAAIEVDKYKSTVAEAAVAKTPSVEATAKVEGEEEEEQPPALQEEEPETGAETTPAPQEEEECA